MNECDIIPERLIIKGITMINYKNVLVAVELIPNNDVNLIKHAEFMIKEMKANITLLHAIEYIGSYGAYGIGVGFDVENVLIENSKKEMKKLGKSVGIPEDKQIVKVGPAKFLILEEAEKSKADLIIVGSHGRHGLRAILGSTANEVLHGAKCDVLSVRFSK